MGERRVRVTGEGAGKGTREREDRERKRKGGKGSVSSIFNAGDISFVIVLPHVSRGSYTLSQGFLQ